MIAKENKHKEMVVILKKAQAAHDDVNDIWRFEIGAFSDSSSDSGSDEETTVGMPSQDGSDAKQTGSDGGSGVSPPSRVHKSQKEPASPQDPKDFINFGLYSDSSSDSSSDEDTMVGASTITWLPSQDGSDFQQAGNGGWKLPPSSPRSSTSPKEPASPQDTEPEACRQEAKERFRADMAARREARKEARQKKKRSSKGDSTGSSQGSTAVALVEKHAELTKLQADLLSVPTPERQASSNISFGNERAASQELTDVDSMIAALHRHKVSRRETTGAIGIDATMRPMNPLGGPPSARRIRDRESEKPVSGGLLAEMCAKLEAAGSFKAENSDGPGKRPIPLQYPDKQTKPANGEAGQKPGDFSRWYVDCCCCRC